MKKAVIFDMYETLITHYKCPVYFSEEMAEDAQLPVEQFLPIWRNTEQDRWTGKMTFEEVIRKIMEKNNCYDEKNFYKIIRKRKKTKEEGFRHLHAEIIPLLEELKERKIKIGLISNCFSEETEVIKKSILYPYFDKVCLSYEEGIQKPDREIYKRCMEKLGVSSWECIYVGDGGCAELETAKELGMLPLQAVWYFQNWIKYQSRRDDRYKQLETPMELLQYL